jgi:uncharacterized ubiquitin-like protein YukD
MIEITLTFVNKQIDLLVPGEVTFDRLQRLIGEAFAARGHALPEGFSLALEGKDLAVSRYDVIGSFGIGNGDRLQITTKS